MTDNTITYGLKFDTKGLNDLLKKIEAGNKLVERATKKISSETVERFNLEKRLLYTNLKINKQTTEQLSSYWKRYYDQVKGFNKKASDEFAKQQVDIAKKQGGSGRSAVIDVPARVAKYIATSTVIYGGYAKIKQGLSAVMDYDQALQNTYAAMGNLNDAQKEQIRLFTQNSALTAKYGKSYAEIAEAMEVLAKAGLNVNDAMLVLEPALGTAVIGNMSVEESAQILTETLKGLGRPLADAGKLANLLAEGAMASTIDIKDLAESMKIAGSTGTAFGMSMEEVVRWMSAAGTTGLKGRNAANAMARDFLRITKESDKFLKVGVNVFDPATNKLRSFIDILKDVSNAQLDITEKQKLLGIYAFKSNEQLLRAIPEYERMLKSIGNTNNALDVMVSEKIKGLNDASKKFNATWNNIFITQNSISDAMTYMYNTLTKIVKLIADNPMAFNFLASLSTGAIAGVVTKNPYIAGAATLSTAAFIGVNQFLNNKEEEKTSDKLIRQGLEQKALEASELENYRNIIKEVKTKKELLEKEKSLKAEIYNLDLLTLNLVLGKKATDADIKRLTMANQELAILKTEIGLFKNVPSRLDDKGKEPEKKYDDISAFLRKMQKLQNDASNLEQEEIQKQYRNNEDSYKEHLQQIYDMDLNRHQVRKATRAAELTWKLQDDKALYDATIKKEKELAEESKRIAERKNAALLQYSVEYQVQQLEIEKEALLRYEFNEQTKLAIREDYALKEMDLLADQYEKQHQLGAIAVTSMKAGFDTLTQSITNSAMTGKQRLDAIWQSMKNSFIQAIAEMAIKWLMFQAITAGLFGGFKSGLGSFVGKLFGINTESFGGTGGKVGLEGVGNFDLGNKDFFSSTGGRSSNGTVQIIERLANIERRIASGNADIVGTIKDNRPIVEGKFISEPEIYTMSKRGEKKAKLIVK